MHPSESASRPIVVIGCPRSGTTLLGTMLHAHPRIAMPPENRFVRESYYRREDFGDLSERANHLALARWITQRKGTNFGDLGLSRPAVVDQIVSAPATIGSASGTVLRAYARRHGKSRWGEKRPAYWQDVPALLALFPDAQIVHLVRDGRACVASLKHVGWWEMGLDGAMTTWAHAVKRIRQDTSHLGPAAYHELRFEDLVSEPRPTLDRLCDFLGETFDDRMLRHDEVAGLVVPRRKTWHALTGEPVRPDRLEAWRTDLEPDEIGLMEFVAGRALRRHGYALSGRGTRPAPSAVARYAQAYAHRELALRKRRMLDAARRRRYPYAIADVPD